MQTKPFINPDREAEKVFIVGIERPALARERPGVGGRTIEDSLAELKELARTAGLVVVGECYQKLKEIHAGTLVGPGKVEEIKEAAAGLDASLILFDDELSPGQQKNLEESFGEELRVMDRTTLILDIFAAHARTSEGQIQVELAQYNYRLPRLTHLWTHLARQAGGRRGGVGLRGPGETQLEIDRRAIRKKIAFLEKELEHVIRQREKQRDKRRGEGFFTVALAGYTNAGKSTLINALSSAELLTEDKLFSTLDPTTRRVKLPGGLTVLVTDTVGFISKLPHHLVAAFRATFEEIGEADLVLHLVDVSHPHAQLLREIVEKELAQTAINDAPAILVWNKIDRLSADARQRLFNDPGRLGISALTGEGLPLLLKEMDRLCSQNLVPVVLRFPYSEGKYLAQVHECGSNVVVSHDEEATIVKALVPRALKEQLSRFLMIPPVEI